MWHVVFRITRAAWVPESVPGSGWAQPPDPACRAFPFQDESGGKGLFRFDVWPDVRLRSPLQEKENPSSGELEGFIMEPLVRFELTTVRLQGGCSTTELKRRGE